MKLINRGHLLRGNSSMSRLAKAARSFGMLSACSAPTLRSTQRQNRFPGSLVSADEINLAGIFEPQIIQVEVCWRTAPDQLGAAAAQAGRPEAYLRSHLGKKDLRIPHSSGLHLNDELMW